MFGNHAGSVVSRNEKNGFMINSGTQAGGRAALLRPVNGSPGGWTAGHLTGPRNPGADLRPPHVGHGPHPSFVLRNSLRKQTKRRLARGLPGVQPQSLILNGRLKFIKTSV